MISTSLFCAKPETKIVLFNSPIYSESQDDKEEHLPPLGLGYIATELNRAGIPTEIVDCVYDRLGIAETVEIINRGAFDYVGFNIFSINIEIVKAILLRLNRKVHVFLGGKVAEHIYDEVAHWGYHYPITVIIGEGELIFPSLIFNNCTEAPIATEGSFSVYRVDVNSAYYPRDLDAITLDRTLFYGREIRNKFGLLESCIIASRGCIYNCAFCGGALHSNPNITPRYRSCPNISNEIKTIIQLSPSTRSIRVLDDLFLRDRKSIITACNIFNAFDDSMMLGKITIREFLSKMIPPAKMQALDEDDWSNILLKWQSTWTPNPIMKQLVTDLSQFGYCVIPFSNLDKQNGDKYLREHYFPSCCVYYYFSYEQNHNKPARKTFIDYEMKLKTWGYNYKSFQILLIDDESANIAQARSRGWQTLQFYNDTPEAIKNLIKELKDRGILPNNYSLPESTPC